MVNEFMCSLMLFEPSPPRTCSISPHVRYGLYALRGRSSSTMPMLNTAHVGSGSISDKQQVGCVLCDMAALESQIHTCMQMQVFGA